MRSTTSMSTASSTAGWSSTGGLPVPAARWSASWSRAAAPTTRASASPARSRPGLRADRIGRSAITYGIGLFAAGAEAAAAEARFTHVCVDRAQPPPGADPRALRAALAGLAPKLTAAQVQFGRSPPGRARGPGRAAGIDRAPPRRRRASSASSASRKSSTKPRKRPGRRARPAARSAPAPVSARKRPSASAPRSRAARRGRGPRRRKGGPARRPGCGEWRRACRQGK
jgi:hypothetical protein